MKRIKWLRRLYGGHGKGFSKRVCALLTAVFLLIASGSFALSEINVRTAVDPDIVFYWQITTFSGEMPEELEHALGSFGFEGYTCYAGALLEEIPKESMKPPFDWLRSHALIALEKDNQRTLVGMLRGENGWRLSMLGEKALLPGRHFTIDISDAGEHSARKLPMRFSITYPKPDGGSEAYGLLCRFTQVDMVMWQVMTYESLDVSGQGYAIASDITSNSFQRWDLPVLEPSSHSFYPAYLPLTVEHMNSITDFPTSEEDAMRLAETSWARFNGTDLAMPSGGVNLREGPTTASKSLGRVRTGALVHVLSQEPGKDAPWYHVRLGREEGYIYGVYLFFPFMPTQSIGQALSYDYLHAARTLDACVLREKPDAQAPAAAELPGGALMHVIADVDDGWLYVMIPRGEIGWEMDVDGISGYLRESDVMQGVSANVLMP